MVAPIVAATTAASTGVVPGISSILGPAIGLAGDLFGGDDYSAYDHWQGLENDFQNWRRMHYITRDSEYYNRGRFIDQDFANQKRTAQQQFKWLVDGAQKAGFNPLTVLKGGGSQLASPGPNVGGYPLMTPSQMPYKSNGIGQAADRIAGMFDQGDPIEQESRRLQNELTQARIDQVNSEQLRLGAGVPQVRTTTSEVETTEPEYRDPHLAFEPGAKKTSIGGYDVPQALAQMFEDAGGDIIGNVAAIAEIANIVAEYEHSNDRAGIVNYAVRMLTNPEGLNPGNLRAFAEYTAKEDARAAKYGWKKQPWDARKLRPKTRPVQRTNRFVNDLDNHWTN